MSKLFIKATRYMTVFISPIAFMLGILFSDMTMINIGILLMWTASVFYCLEDKDNRVYQLAFLISFFAFLLGRSVAMVITPRINYHNFENNILIHTSICLYISLVTLLLFSWIFEHVKFSSNSHNTESWEIDYESPKYVAIRKISKLIFFSTYVFSMVTIFEKIIYVRALGYISYYTGYSSRLPYVFTKLGDFTDIAFFIFLATMPSKRECKFPIVLFLIESFASLFTGRRGDFVIPVMILIIYLITRNKINRGESDWFTKRMIRVLIVAIPIALVGLYSYSFIRVGASGTQESIIDRISGFFNETGFSVNIINYEKYYENVLPHKLFSLGDTIDYLRENIIVSKLFNIPVYKNHTIEKALNSFNFTQVITYFYSQSYYLSGHGLGSCYIAEAYHDFGYLGVVIWNIIYSFVLSRMYNFRGKGVIYTTLGFLSLRFMLFAPRNMTSAFLTEWISLDNWLVIGLIMIASNFLLSRSTKHSLSIVQGKQIR